MRKYVVGIIIGAVLMFSAQAGAASLLGSRVSKVYTVNLDGKDIGNAPVIGGVTYVPARSFANEYGLKLDRKGDVVLLTTPEDLIETDDIAESTTQPTVDPKQTELEVIIKRIGEISVLNGQYIVKNSELMIQYNSNPDKRDDIQKQIDKLAEDIKPLIAERETLEARKAQLEAQP